MKAFHALLLAGLGLAVAAPVRAQEAPGDTTGVRRVTLEEALSLAARRSPALAQSAAQRDQAAASRLGALGGFLPSLDLSYGYQHSNTGRLDPTGQGISQTSHTLQLRGSYDLFTGFRRVHAYREAALRLDAQDAAYRESEFSTLTDVKQAWFAAVAARDLVRVEQERVQRQKEQLDFVARELALGRATRSDSLRSGVDLNTARLDLLNASNDARQSRYQLARAIGLDEPAAPEETAELEVGEPPISREEALAMARRESPAIVSARASADAARAAVSASRAAYFPSLSLSAGEAWRNDQFPPENRSWSLSVSASYPLFNRLQRESDIDRSQASAAAAEASLRSSELSTTAAVDAAYGRIETARAGVDLAEETVALAREDLRVTEERYRVRLATILDLQASQIALRQAEVDLIQRRFDYAIGVAQLEALLGRSFE